MFYARYISFCQNHTKNTADWNQWQNALKAAALTTKEAHLVQVENPKLSILNKPKFQGAPFTTPGQGGHYLDNTLR